jgi:Putative zinc-finger
MEERASEFSDTLLELIEASPEPVDHPSPEQWIAYHRGELADDEAARLQEHLVRCRDCFDLAAGAAAFAQPDEEPNAGQEVETAALWRLLRPRLAPSSPGNVRAISPGPRRRPSWGSRLPSLLAASFFVALVGLTAWNLRQRSVLEALRQPQPNAPIFDIGSVERAPGGREWTVPARPLMLVLRPSKELPAYRLVIRDDAAGREISSHELRPNQDLVLTLYFPELKPGRYRLEISSARGGGVLETRLLRVTAADRGD